MASFKLNIARIQGCPPPAELAKLLEKFGLPDSEEFGVLNYSATAENVFGTIVRKTNQAVQRLDAESKEVTAQSVEKVTLYPFGVSPSTERLELYAGSAAGIEQAGAFFASCLALATVVEPIDLDIPAAIGKLMKSATKFQLKALRISDYSHNSYMTGAYAPKFLDSQHGQEFMEEYAEQMVSASVKFAAPTGRANVTLTPKACFGFSCNEDDQPAVQSILRKLV
jgi:hypothetical protein